MSTPATPAAVTAKATAVAASPLKTATFSISTLESSLNGVFNREVTLNVHLWVVLAALVASNLLGVFLHL